MDSKDSAQQIEQKIVVAFDICCSTRILEDLHKSENTVIWRNFLAWIENYLKAKSEELNFSIYKFTGDGWILLFDPNCPGEDLVGFLQGFCSQFRARYKRRVEEYLETPPERSGVTFGIDRGSLVGVIMNNQEEFVGRAINVACRLQAAIKDKDKSPQYKALIAKPLYMSTRGSWNALRQATVRRTLRNIAGGEEVRCVKVWLL
ncbi:hypothetical protein [Candidatus Methylomirabilis sp.]|uniref:hypothetical protein n=1 Tax=Candidatus Methylomirabilis sp. TaxID=2032687 RepID=UPI0030761B53